MVVLDTERELDMKIEMVKELLYKKIKGDISSEDVQEINESLNKFTTNSNHSTDFLNFSQVTN
jgi:hypothetical protein